MGPIPPHLPQKMCNQKDKDSDKVQIILAIKTAEQQPTKAESLYNTVYNQLRGIKEWINDI